MKVFWTQYAESQLDDIYDYIENHNLISATSIYNDILDESAMLAHFPRMGAVERLLSDFSEEYRYLVVHRNYKIVYFIDNESIIYVVAVFDCRQNPQKLKKDVAKFSKN
jgi:plasmid stabilization system protein ParE